MFMRFAVLVVVAEIVTYYLAGMFAFPLGTSIYYPPSPTALSYLRDPLAIQPWPVLAAALRGFLFAVVLYPFWGTILSMPRWRGGLAVASVVFVAGYVAAAGGMIEHFVWFEPAAYPVRFAAITFVEVLGQALIMGQLVVRVGARYCAR